MPAREIAALLTLLEDENPDVASAARGRLVALGEEALPALDAAALREDPHVRLHARGARDSILGDAAERRLIERLKAGPLDLEACSIELARTDRPLLDVEALTHRIDEYADRVRARVAAAATVEERAAALGAVLHGEEGFSGNVENYYRPHNSYLDWVLDLKKGIPISLSLLYVFVGRRAGLDVYGVGFPRHFVAGFREGEYVAYLDAFQGGRVLDRRQAEAMLHQQNLPAHASLFEEAAPYDVVRRMLANLAFAYRDRKDAVRAARVGRLLAALEVGRTKS